MIEYIIYIFAAIGFLSVMFLAVLYFLGKPISAYDQDLKTESDLFNRYHNKKSKK